MIRYFDNLKIYFAEICLPLIAIEKQFIKARDQYLPITLLFYWIRKSKANKVCKEFKTVIHIIKFIAPFPANNITKAILDDYPNVEIRAIANAVLNFKQNSDVKLDPATRNLF